MNTKLLASIAVFVLLAAVVSIPMVNSAFAAEPKKDDAKAKADKKAAEAKAKADKKAAEAKAKADKKAADAKAKADKKAAEAKAKADKKATKDSSAGKTASGTPAKEVEVDMPKGAAMPACADTDSCFSPSEATVSVGGTVTWVNNDSAAHTVTSGKDMSADGKFDSSMIMVAGKFSHKFDTAGTYDYFCMVHPFMHGKVIAK